jgi:hypothetical protein
MNGKANNKKGNNHTPKKGEKGIARIVRIVEEMQADAQKFREEWADKFNGLKERFDRIVPAIAQQFAQVQVNSQINAQCINNIDLQQQAMLKILKRVFGKFEVIDAIFRSQNVNIDDLDYEAIKRLAEDTYTAVAEECVEIAEQERAAAIKSLEESGKKACEEVAAAERAKKEAETAEAALRQAHEEDRIVREPGGPGTEIPAGAEVFGG